MLFLKCCSAYYLFLFLDLRGVSKYQYCEIYKYKLDNKGKIIIKIKNFMFIETFHVFLSLDNNGYNVKGFCFTISFV